jgi:hypothetical protein
VVGEKYQQPNMFTQTKKKKNAKKKFIKSVFCPVKVNTISLQI